MVYFLYYFGMKQKTFKYTIKLVPFELVQEKF